MIKTPRITALEYELIINKKLYDKGIITEQQYEEVCKMIYKKISCCSKEIKNWYGEKLWIFIKLEKKS